MLFYFGWQPSFILALFEFKDDIEISGIKISRGFWLEHMSWNEMKNIETDITFRQMKQGEEADVVKLVLDVFSEFVAPQYSVEGISEFKKYANESALAERFKSGNPLVVAESEKEIIGVIEIRDNSHIALLFVNKPYQKKGVAKKLIREAVRECRRRNPNIQKFTVNSSPNAVAAYQHIGFKGENNVKIVNGIQFVPLELEINPHIVSRQAAVGSPGGAGATD